MAPALGDLALGRLRANGAAERTAAWALVVPWLVLAGVLALRAAVIFSAQA
jgi:sirohydrochlorin ferrochelatase